MEKRRFLSLAASAIGAAALPLSSAEIAPSIVVSGFQPFGGRGQNASWILAQSIACLVQEGASAIEIPVEWGAPLRAIESIVPAPDIWIALGEGTQQFQIEMVGVNQRGSYLDNRNSLPPQPAAVKGGPPLLENHVDPTALAAALNHQGFGTIVSRDAGSYLCEEMLYSLLHAQRSSVGGLSLVLFIHVPVVGAKLPLPLQGGKISQPPAMVDVASLARFGKVLLDEVLKMYTGRRAGR